MWEQTKQDGINGGRLMYGVQLEKLGGITGIICLKPAKSG